MLVETGSRCGRRRYGPAQVSLAAKQAVAPQLHRGGGVSGRGPWHHAVAIVSLFLCAVMLSAWLGGVGPGLLAAGLSAAAFAYYFLSPVHSLIVAAEVGS